MVTLNGKDHYLGRWNTKASRAEYDRLTGEWLAGGRHLLPGDKEAGLTIAELVLRYWKFARTYYRKDGRPTGAISGIRVALRILRKTYGDAAVADFGPLALKALRTKMVNLGQSRRYVNDNIDWIRRVFRWGVAEQLVPPRVYQALRALPGLRRGRTEAREAPPVRPVADHVVDATLPHLPEVVADMVRLQRLTGCRPGEVCIIRPCEVDTSGDVWTCRPESHKTEHHGRDRVICIGPKAQDVLRPYLLRPAECYCFCPQESERKRLALRHEKRQVPLHYGNRPGTNCKRKPKRRPGERYDTNSYRRAIHRAVELANRKRKEQGETELLAKWGPNRLRHSAATEIRKQFGLEAVQVTLGHTTADVSQIYAERDLGLAIEIMRKIG